METLLMPLQDTGT
ncbi:UNVERIFIED_CONTAM: hypothetical protein H355_005863 [Colinus virginianus]|nr:hypothetical protein H355_005863 [Colinus virginianus]